MLAQRTIRTTCPTAASAAACVAKRRATRVKIAGDPEHPANFGQPVLERIALGDRRWASRAGCCTRRSHGQRVSWDDALDHVAQ